MRVTDLSLTEHEGLARISARLTWEDRAAPDARMWFDFPAGLAREVEASPNAFLPSALACSIQTGERRVLIEGAICPRHLEGLGTVAAIFASWFPQLAAPRIETTRGTSAPATAGDRSAICLSGGVDSLAALEENHRIVPPGHPGFIRDGLVYFGLNTYDFDATAQGSTPRRERLAAFMEHCRRLEQLGARSGVTVIPVRTNVRALSSSWEEWRVAGHAAALVAGAHALPNRVRALTIASHGMGVTDERRGTHPLLDPHYSTLALDVRTVHALMPRLEKVRRIAEWPEALAALRVCLMFDIPAHGFPNCGQCYKCVRTMLELLLCGALDRASTFPGGDVTREMILGLSVHERPLFYLECRAPLASMGRHDLVDAIDERMGARARAVQSKSLMRRLFRR